MLPNKLLAYNLSTYYLPIYINLIQKMWNKHVHNNILTKVNILKFCGTLNKDLVFLHEGEGYNFSYLQLIE